MPRTPTRLVLLLIPPILLSLAGCPPLDPPPATVVEGDAALRPFESRDQLLTYFKDQLRQSQQRQRAGNDAFGLLPLFAAAPPAADQAAEGGANDGGSANATDNVYSTTNIQEVGVDESDIFKSDGEFFYIAGRQTLRIVKAAPMTDFAERGQLDLGGTIDSFYLFGDKLIALVRQWGNGTAAEIWPPYYRDARLAVCQVDISDANAPTLVRQNEIDGALINSRLTNGRLVLVLTIQPDLPANPSESAIQALTLEEVLPHMTRAGQAEYLVPPDRWLRPDYPDGYAMTAVVVLDANNIDTLIGSTAVMARAGTIYATPQSLYLTNTEYNPQGQQRETTAIHKFVFNDAGVAEYIASGAVPGRLLNQFSLDEEADYLRVATHVNNWNLRWGGPVFADATADAATAQANTPVEGPYNAVYVLGVSGTDLGITGAIEYIAPNEDLHSARFLGDHGFLVTFEKIDPLFVLDLADPANPKIMGELKVPGFSDYLHPIGDDHLIGIGKYTVEADGNFQWFQGVQVSLFDVSDWSNPTAVQQITLGGRGSFCETDRTHKAFTFMPGSNLLLLPMHLRTIEEIPFNYGDIAFDGVVVFQVDTATGFTELGRLPAVLPDDPTQYWTTRFGDAWWDGPAWRRAAFINDVVYGLTPMGVRAAPLSDLAATQSVELAPAPGDQPPPEEDGTGDEEAPVAL